VSPNSLRTFGDWGSCVPQSIFSSNRHAIPIANNSETNRLRGD